MNPYSKSARMQIKMVTFEKERFQAKISIDKGISGKIQDGILGFCAIVSMACVLSRLLSLTINDVVLINFCLQTLINI